MIANGRLMGFLATRDYDRAREFFVGKLGAKFVSLDQFALVVEIGGHSIRIVKIADFTPVKWTVLGWEVDDVAAAVKWLAERGVTTEKYPFVTDKEWGIWEAPGGAKVAWFTDADGNVLSVSQQARG